MTFDICTLADLLFIPQAAQMLTRKIESEWYCEACGEEHDLSEGKPAECVEGDQGYSMWSTPCCQAYFVGTGGRYLGDSPYREEDYDE